jgi:hypothetical protein
MMPRYLDLITDGLNNHIISNLAKIKSCASMRLYYTNSYDVFFTLRLHASETSCARRFIARFDIGPSIIESRQPRHHLKSNLDDRQSHLESKLDGRLKPSRFDTKSVPDSISGHKMTI